MFGQSLPREPTWKVFHVSYVIFLASQAESNLDEESRRPDRSLLRLVTMTCVVVTVVRLLVFGVSLAAQFKGVVADAWQTDLIYFTF